MSEWECNCDQCRGTLEPPDYCEYCSRWNDTLQLHDGTCDGITKEMWVARFGDES
jgi:hypothetical protein